MLPKVEEECKRLIEKYKLTDIVILATSKPYNYFAYCLKKLNYQTVMDILEESHADRKFVKKHRTFPFRCDVLRITKKGRIPKPFFCTMIFSSYSDGEHSLAHALAFRKIFNIPYKMQYKYDDLTVVKKHYYKTEVKR